LPAQDVRQAGEDVCELPILAPGRDEARAREETCNHRFGRGDGKFPARAQRQHLGLSGEQGRHVVDEGDCERAAASCGALHLDDVRAASGL